MHQYGEELRSPESTVLRLHSCLSTSLLKTVHENGIKVVFVQEGLDGNEKGTDTEMYNA